MSRALVQCDEAPIPTSLEQETWDVREHIRHRSGDPDLNLLIENLSHACLHTVDRHASDLVRIAAYVYAADQIVRRGGMKDVYGKHWRREFSLVIPVSDSDFWMQEQLCLQLEAMLAFLTDDGWHFYFTSGVPQDQQMVLNFDKPELYRSPDSVVLFSGGADSLCAVVEAVEQAKRRPVLVSHRSTFSVNARQRRLIQDLRHSFKEWEFPHISVWVHRRGSEAKETSQRTRSFLYASLGAATGSQLGVESIILADNGIVSMNLPINDQLVGALATRSTHPKFIDLFNSFAKMVLPTPTVVYNPLKYRTKSEALNVLKVNGCSQLLQETVSCAHSRGRPESHPHCGVCSQCIDRRFSTIIANLEEDDLPERYEVDIFTDPLAEGAPRTLAESYVRFALNVRRTAEEELFDAYPQLHNCILPTDDAVATAQALASLLKRHAEQVMKVVETRFASLVPNIVAGSLPSTCLISLVASQRHLEDMRLRTIKWLTNLLERGLPPIFEGRRPRDERDVQNAANGLLKGVESKIWREVPLLPFAGIATKPDFSAKDEKSQGWLFVEMKYVSDRRRLNGIVTEITSKATIYRKQGALVLFGVYDDRRCIVDDEAFKADCTIGEGSWVEIIR